MFRFFYAFFNGFLILVFSDFLTGVGVGVGFLTTTFLTIFLGSSLIS